MKKKVYLRIAEGRHSYPIKAENKKNYSPLEDSSGRALPTIFISLELEFDYSLFRRADAELKINLKNAELATKIEVTEKETQYEKENNN